jgi:hypothetical protein
MLRDGRGFHGPICNDSCLLVIFIRDFYGVIDVRL